MPGTSKVPGTLSPSLPEVDHVNPFDVFDRPVIFYILQFLDNIPDADGPLVNIFQNLAHLRGQVSPGGEQPIGVAQHGGQGVVDFVADG